MVRNPSRAVGSRKYKDFSPQQLEKAVNAVKKGMSLRKANEKFGISRSTINRAITGKNSGEVGRPYVIDEAEQLTLAKCISTAGDWGFPLTLYDIRLLVKAYLDRAGKTEGRFHENLPGREFAMSFLVRHKSLLSAKMCQNIKRNRAKVDKESINQYFDELNESVRGVPSNLIVNYDETNITDDPGRIKVVVRRGCRHPERIIDSSKSSTSVMFSAAGDGTLLPPYINYKAENLYNTWTVHGPKDAVYNRSKSGWFTLEIFEDWFRKIALPYFSKFDKNDKKVMIGDNLASHISADIVQQCTEHNISFVLLPPNSTGITQPLDVAFFRPLKIKWRQTLDAWKTKNRGTIPKDVFPRLLNKCLLDMGEEQISKNVISGFRGTGLVPLDRDQVLKRLPSKEEESSSSQDNSMSWVHTLQEYLDHSRRKETEDMRKPKKRKINVPPGRGIRVEDIKELEKPSGSIKPKKKQGAGLLTDKTSKTNKPITSQKKKKTKIYSSDEEDDQIFDESDMCDESSDDDLDTFRNKQLAKLAKENEEESLTRKASIQKEVKKEVGYFVVVQYEGTYYPGVIEKCEKDGVLVSAMQKTLKEHWKWPVVKDELFYRWEDIVGGINPPKMLNKRGFFSVPELEDLQ